MTAAKYDMIIEQGSNFQKIFTYKDNSGNLIDLTGYTSEMQIRSTYDSTILISLTTENNRIILGDELGTVTIVLTPEETRDLDFTKAKYDLELYSGSNVYRFIEGDIELSREITK